MTAMIRSSKSPEEQTLQERIDVLDWTEHWSENNQRSISQRFFSFYRKNIFARSVKFFINRHFPPSGIFVEAGSGTSETSIRLKELNDTRLLVAVDIIEPVLRMCHPIMDARIGGDIFRMPFRENSVDGIWNVGVMEHFTHDQIDQIMGEFHRVLKHHAPIILLWPGSDSVPQRFLRALENVINLRQNNGAFRFHPAEISKLESAREGSNVLRRNGFRVVDIEPGYRSLMAFKTLIGIKEE